MKTTATLTRRAALISMVSALPLYWGTGTANATPTSSTSQVQRTILAPVLQRAIIIVGGLPLEDLVFLNPQPIPPGLGVHPPNPARPLLFPSLGTA